MAISAHQSGVKRSLCKETGSARGFLGRVPQNWDSHPVWVYSQVHWKTWKHFVVIERQFTNSSNSEKHRFVWFVLGNRRVFFDGIVLKRTGMSGSQLHLHGYSLPSVNSSVWDSERTSMEHIPPCSFFLNTAVMSLQKEENLHGILAGNVFPHSKNPAASNKWDVQQPPTAHESWVVLDPQEMAVVPSEHEALGKQCPSLPHVFSTVVLQEMKEDGEVVTLVPEHAGQIWHLPLPWGGCSEENRCWDCWCHHTCLTCGFVVNDSSHVLLLSHLPCPADDSGSATRVGEGNSVEDW